MILLQCPGDQPRYTRFLDLVGSVHRDYAERCGATYWPFVGWVDRELCPTWNRISLILDAFDAGAEKVVYMDVDSLVVDPTVDIYANTADDVAFQMVRMVGIHEDVPWSDPAWDLYEDGVMVVNNTTEAVDALQWIWDHRQSAPRAHHNRIFFEQNWLWDWLIEHRDHVADLDVRYNWMAWNFVPPESEARAVIRSFHGLDHHDRWTQFVGTFRRYHEALR